MMHSYLLLLSIAASLLLSSVFAASNYTFVQQQRILQSSPGQNNFFGWSMNVDKSFTYMAVGAPLSNSFAGRVNVFQRTPSGVPTTSAFSWAACGSGANANVLSNTIDSLPFDFFGQEVFVGYNSVTGQAMVAVYAMRSDVSRAREGGVYLFSRAHNDDPAVNPWATSGGFANVDATAGTNGKLRPINSTQPFRFGEALTGDLERVGGGDPILVVGEFRFDKKTGRVHVYYFSGGEWYLNGTINAPSGWNAPNSGFGISLSLRNDYLAVGSSGAQLNRGVVHMYKDMSAGTVPNFVLLRSVRALGGVIGDQYGWSVALNDDWLIIGANRREDCGVGCGAVYANFRDTGATPSETLTDGWGQKVKMEYPYLSAGAQLGYHVAITGDFVVAGAPEGRIDNVTASTGEVLIFQKNTGPDGFFKADSWGYVGRFGRSGAQAGDRLGRRVSTYSPHVMATAMLVDDTASNQGAAYYFIGNTPLGGTTGDPEVNPNVTLSTTTTTTSTSGDQSSTNIAAGSASAVSCDFLEFF